MNVPDKAREFVLSLGYQPPVPLQQIFPNCSPVGLHLLEAMLTVDPNKRISGTFHCNSQVEQALAHPYFQTLHNPSQEPSAQVAFDFSFEVRSRSR